jgi:acyl-CoA reductase-like NAD-dependent aldehyde dehydrogenase
MRIEQFGHYINGHWREPRSGRYFDSEEPARMATWYRAARGDSGDVDLAVTAARRAFDDPDWRGMLPARRGRLLRGLASAIEHNATELATLEARDNGKLVREMRSQMRALPDYIHYYAGLADKLRGDLIQGVAPDTLNYTVREPLGVVAAITAWNSPLFLAAMKLAPALATGNTVVLKPSEYTSRTSLLLGKLCIDAGFPPGAVNVVTGFGDEVGAPLVTHPAVAKIAFTGSTQTGLAISAQAGSRRTSLELGGKSPNIVFADADLDSAVAGITAGVFAAAGQMCTSGSRLLVHDAVYDELVERIIRRANRIRVGDPSAPDTELGPLISRAQFQRVTSYIDQGVRDGAVLAAGGAHPDAPAVGYFVNPTVLTRVDNAMAVAREEVFGPVLSVIRFASTEEAIAIANDTNFGLAAGVWTRDLALAHRMSAELNAGIVWVNTYRNESALSPFGGFQDSGTGKENGTEAILEYTRLKSVWVNYADSPVADPFTYPA